MSELEHVGDDPGSLVVPHGVVDELGVTSEEVDDLPGLGLGDQFGLDLSDVFGKDDVGVLSLDRTESDVRVLDVRAARAVEVA